MDSSIRSTNYAIEEDKLLCHVYLDVSQNPIIGINQSKEQFWSRIEEAYNVGKSERMQERNKRSMQCRMQVILRAVRKLCGCVSIIEKLNPSGASEEDILNRAKDLMMQDKNFTKGFKFDHVWPILKEMEKFSAEDSAPKEGHREILSVLQQGRSDTREMRMLALQNEQKKISLRQEQLALAKHQEENKILYIDVSTIGDPVLRQIVENNRARIMQKREEERRQQEGNSFGQYFGDIGGSGSGSDFPNY
ncbi:uncharacterized protein [Henckelia pumila]|uniref:uncharacterized protein n=1 Tax=Henckelia pumila TaxID=405737 RepID=UPI003C6E75A1